MTLSLVVLALVDSTSIGTLFVPVLLMLAPGRPKVAAILGYLATIAGFYLAVGLAVALGAGPLLADALALLDGRPGYWLELVAGVALFVLSFRFERRRKPPVDWRARVQKKPHVLAVTAGLLELATMFPYLAAIALLAGAGLGGAGTAVVLAGYCVVMILPALVLLALRVWQSDRITPLLAKVNSWFERHAAGATGWILAIVGFLLARDAAFHLGLFDAWLED